ncbi:AAA family ATPase [Massilimicrobiota sp. An142]|uniref:ATP-dependent DNA helicase n=1 Tax=Massilimicrobiota sp. An142 TaxID=1965564 RepID=UPI0013028C68|nr:AAA family ATPase [Massilimicrobiota sp. An142]
MDKKFIKFKIQKVLFSEELEGEFLFRTLAIAKDISCDDDINDGIVVKIDCIIEVSEDFEIEGTYDVFFDKKFGQCLYLPFASANPYNDKKFIQILKYIFKNILNNNQINLLYKDFGQKVLNSSFVKRNVLEEIGVEDDLIEEVIRIVKFYETYLNACSGANNLLKNNKNLKNASNDFSSDMIKDNIYYLAYYGVRVQDLDWGYRSYLNKERTQACLFQYISERFKKNGDMFVKIDKNTINDIVNYVNLINRQIQVKDINIDDIISYRNGKEMFKKVNNFLYIRNNYYIEKDISKCLRNLSSKKICEISYDFQDNLSFSQNLAIKNSINYPLSIITGGPGTGKSFTITEIVKKIISLQKTVMVLSPTGRVADALSKKINDDRCICQTIHRGIGLNNLEYVGSLKDINTDYVIVDECSMIDIILFKYLIQHINKNSKLILVGDYNQLPPIGGCNIFKKLVQADFNSSFNIFKIKLNEIHRLSSISSIIKNSQNIINGCKTTDLITDNNFYYIDAGNFDTEKIAIKAIDNFIKQRNVNIDDIMILNPNNNFVRNINKKIQEKYNLENCSIKIGNRVFKKGDKVVQIKNNYDIGVFNGNVGKIIDISCDNIIVDFDSKIVKYDKNMAKELDIAYAITIHKSQGSEAQYVFVIIDKNSKNMLNMNLIYTAITRAKECCVLIGASEDINLAFSKSAENNGNSNIIKLINDGYI